MHLYSLRGSTAAAVLLLSAPAALADLTAQDVWSEWKSYLASSGYEVTAQEQDTGNGLALSDISLVLQIPEEEDSVLTVLVPGLTLVETGDGSVDVEMPSPSAISIKGTEKGEDKGSAVLTYSHTNGMMNVSGSPEAMVYEHSSDSSSFEIGEVVSEGKAMTPEQFSARADIGAVSGRTEMTKGDMRTFTQQAEIASVSYDVAFDDPESDDTGNFNGNLEGLKFDGDGSIPTTMSPGNMAAMMEAGFDVTGNFTYTGGNSSITGKGDGEDFALSSASGGGGITFEMGGNSILYDVVSRNLDLSISSGELPFPVALKSAEAGFKIDMPVSTTEEPEPFALGVTLSDFTMSDMIWGLFDPAGTLPRDPATLIVDLGGQARMLFDLMDPAQSAAATNSSSPPAELHALDVNKLLLSVVGAELTGQGAFSFDNSDLQTFPGMPRPEGAIDLQLVGANALIDNLIKMGIVKEQDAMGARMMMGMMAVPGDGPDTLKSKIEINEQGQVLANGQRIR